MLNSQQGGISRAGTVSRSRRIVTAIFLSGAALAIAGASAIGQSAEAPSISVVNGLAPGDFLNVRATPSPIGQIQARLPNGTGARNFGCSPYSGYDWCKVTTLTAPQVSGWAPGRYLRDASKSEEDVLKEMAAPSTDAASAGQAASPTWTDHTAPSGAAPAAVPENLDARIAGDGEGTDPAAQPDGEKLREAIIARYGPLYRSALGQPKSGEAGNAALDADAAGDADQGQEDGTNAQGVPHPTPRPDKPGEALASVEPAQKATGEIPCAGAFGQPMSACRAAVTRLGPGIADIVVNLPQGGARTIRFRGGKPDGSDSSDPVQASREGSLNMIRIGKAERFEILDALAFGE